VGKAARESQQKRKEASGDTPNGTKHVGQCVRIFSK